jgi:exopolysaccharide biosynthesis polyprenyl glycosylphosphotransferase
MGSPYGRDMSAIATAGPARRGARNARAWRLLDRRRDLVLGPLAGAIMLAFLADPSTHLRTGVLSFGCLTTGAVLAARVGTHAALLPLMRHVHPLLGPALGLAGVACSEWLTGAPGAGPLDGLAALGTTGLVVHPWAGILGATPPGGVRAAFIGSPKSASRLARALAASGSSRYRLIGRVSCHDGLVAGDPPTLGCLAALPEIVVEHDVDLLVMASDAPRLEVFQRVADSCLDLQVGVVELSSLFEEVFGHVPTAEINAAWFQCLADPDVRVATGPVKRTIDVVGAAVLLALTLPLQALLVVLIRRDGGPGLFSQERIGEGGRRFRLIKLRTMRVGADASAQWACADDPRTTGIGAFLRRTHLDELPQLVNVLRGEMSLVGPRPEQPEFVERLERMLPLYQRRHLMRPGITGWAQIRCGYAGSDVGSAWKLCHDLYYVKHRSLGMDVLILFETLATLVLEREPVMRPENVAFVLADDD